LNITDPGEASRAFASAAATARTNRIPVIIDSIASDEDVETSDTSRPQ
jgi:hypothetical protein